MVVPLYNAERYVEACLATIRENVRDGYRFVLVDDHSTDASPKIVEAALGSMPYVTFLRNDRNLGAAGSRNVALEQLDSRYLTFLDVDDWWAPGHLDRLVAAIKELGVDMLRTDHTRVEDGVPTVVLAPEKRRDVVLPGPEGIGTFGRPSLVNYPFLWAGIYDATAIDHGLFRFDETLRSSEDRPWFWRMHLEVATYGVVGLDGYHYRKDTGSGALTQATSETALHFTDAYHRIFDLVLPGGTEQQVLKASHDAVELCVRHLVNRRDRYSPALRNEMASRAVDLVARIPEPAMRDLLGTKRRATVAYRTLFRRLWHEGHPGSDLPSENGFVVWASRQRRSKQVNDHESSLAEVWRASTLSIPKR